LSLDNSSILSCLDLDLAAFVIEIFDESLQQEVKQDRTTEGLCKCLISLIGQEGDGGLGGLMERGR
jgi:hypothetical protein